MCRNPTLILLRCQAQAPDQAERNPGVTPRWARARLRLASVSRSGTEAESSSATRHHKADHRTGGQIPSHSRETATRRGQTYHGQRQHHQKAAQRPAQIPLLRPAAHADPETDQHACAVPSPHSKITVEMKDLVLERVGTVNEIRNPTRYEAEKSAKEEIRHRGYSLNTATLLSIKPRRKAGPGSI